MPGNAGHARIGRYEIVRQIGRGGMAVVYEALDTDLGRRIALKVLRASEAGPGVVERLHREARAAAKLRHPNIVSVHDVGQADGVHYIAMDYVAGTTLEGAVRTMSARQRIEAMETVAEAVAYAHRQGVIHRDLKPQNVLVEESPGRVYLTDFGLARVVEADDLTRTGSAVGTPYYMAPEQVRGDKQEIGPRTDVWGLGVMLYELLGERLPFPGRTVAEVYDRILRNDPAPLPHVHPDLETICLRALSKEPARRYGSADELADDLRRALAGEPIAARRASWGYRLAKAVRRQPAAFGLAGLLAAAVLALIAVVATQRVRGERSAREVARHHVAEAERILASLPADPRERVQALIRADDHSRLGDERRLRYRVNRMLGDAALDGGDFGVARMAYSACMAIDASEDLVHRVDEREQAEARRRGARIAAALEDLRGGLGRQDRPPGAPLLEDYVFECVQYNDEQTVNLLGEALGRLEERARAQGRWTQEDRDVMVFAFRVLGRLGRESCVGPLARMLTVLSDEALIVECGVALCNTRCAAAHGPLMALRERVGGNSDVWRAITRLLPRVPDAVSDAELRTSAELDRRGVLRFAKGDGDGAMDDFNRAIELDPSNASAFSNRGSVHAARGAMDRAIADYTRAIELDPRRASAFINRGRARNERGDVGGAIEDCARAIALDPSNAAAYSNRGAAYRKKGDLAAAIADYTRAIEVDPKSSMAYGNRGNARRDAGDLDGAVQDYTRAVELDPRYALAFVNRGRARVAKGDLELGVEDLTRAIELDPRSAVAFSARGNARRLRGDLEGALEDLTRAVHLDPASAAALNLRGVVREMKNDLNGALDDFTRAIQADPKSGVHYENRGMAWIRKGDPAAAIADFDRALELGNASPNVLLYRGEVRRIRRDLTGAAADWERFLQLAPNDPQAPKAREALKALRAERERE